jgi:23S rRNA G2069 N7-methylase RlmK/C1962 C5-methylase RlmI
VDVLDFSGRFVGRGYLNPRTLIAVRLLSRKPETIDTAFFLSRIETAGSSSPSASAIRIAPYSAKVTAFPV